MNDLKYAFNHDECSELSGKPKLFVIQACRGGKYMSFDHLYTQQQPKEKDSEVLTNQWPREEARTLAPIRDTLDVYASLSESVSFRCERKGKLLAVNRWQMISNRSFGQVLSSCRGCSMTCSRLARTAETFTMSFTRLKNKWLPNPCQ